MKTFVLFGSPVAKSLSPTIHQAFAKELRIVLQYTLQEIRLGQLDYALGLFHAAGGTGANITLPLKHEAFRLCHPTERAKRSGVVNVLYWQNDQLFGDNTDGEGLVRDLTLNLKLNLQGKRLLILGAGGVARGIVPALLDQGVDSIVVVHRSEQPLKTLTQQDPRIMGYLYEEFQNVNKQSFDIVLNATSASLQNELPPLHGTWIKGAIAIDLAYDVLLDTVFVQWAKENGALAAYDGIGMLVEQAALSFQIWHGILPETKSIIQRLNQKR